MSEEVICRWFYDDVILDVMPTDEKILGFGNRWYKEAIASSIIYSLTDKIDIRIVTAPYFLATKLEAFKTRGKMDFYASHDFEDIVSVLDGRIEIIDEIKNASRELKEYLLQFLFDITDKPSFKGAIPGHFIQYGNLANDRIEIFERKLTAIINRLIMKLAWLTDIHLNFLDNNARQIFYQEIVNTQCDGVLISGDIAEAPSLISILEEMARSY